MLSSFSTFQSLDNYATTSFAPPFTLNSTGGILRYNMDRSGTSVTDSFASRHGSVTGTALWSSSVPSSFTNLATSSWGPMSDLNNYISTSSFSISSRNVSISCWIFPNGGASQGDIKWWELDKAEGPHLFQNRNTTNYGYDYLITWSLANNQWHHIVCIDDYTNLNKMVYINGSLYSTVSFASNTSFFISSASTCNGVRVGRGFSAHQAPQGNITDFRVYNRILSASEVTALYNKSA